MIMPVLQFTIRDLDVARKFPQQPPIGGRKGPGRSTPPICPADQIPMMPVVITTYDPFGEGDLWQTYPLALDGWRCSQCGRVGYPALLDPEEVRDLVTAGNEAARRGDLDEAEYHLRRLASSRPGYSIGRVNLASVYLDRLRTAEGDDVTRYVEMVTSNLEDALLGKPPPPPVVRLTLGRVYVRSGDRERGEPLLRQVIEDPASTDDLRAAARDLLAE